jgi:Zn-dependent protease
MFGRGFTTLFTLWDIPVRAHFTILLGFLFISGLRFAPGAWLAYFLIVVIHELGHAFFARRYRLHVYRIDIHGLGGYCMHEATSSALQTSVIAWGGVVGQSILLAGALLYLQVASWPDSPTARELVDALIGWNLVVIALNLLPIRGLDGREAWRLPRLVYLRWQKARIAKRLVKVKRPRKKQHRLESAGEPKLKLVRDAKGDFRFEQDEEEKEEN